MSNDRIIRILLQVIERLLRNPADFSREDQTVRDSTEKVLEAKDRLPHQDQQQTGEH